MERGITWRLGVGKKKGDSREQPQNDDAPKCTFCDKSKAEVGMLMASPSRGAFRAYICNECIEVCNLIEQDSKGPLAKTPSS